MLHIKTTAARGVAVLGLAAALVAGSATASGAAVTSHQVKSAPVAAWSGHHGKVFLGKVISRKPLNIRARPTTRSRILGSLRPGTIIKIRCKTIGQSVRGNRIWYKLAKRPGWVSARFVRNLGPSPRFCERRHH